MEHLNRLCKTAIQELGANKHDSSIIHVGKALGTLSPVLSKFNNDNQVIENAGIHKSLVREKDVNLVVQQLQKANNLAVIPGRKHTAFRKVRDILHHEEHTKLVQWMKKHYNSLTCLRMFH